MRNLKRALSLGLASAMTLGSAAFGASAATFKDQDKVTNEKAVSIVHEIGLMIGDEEGYFNPEEPVTRAEMAVICTTMLNGANFHVSQFVDTDVFTDVPAWASDYVNLAASLGIVDGRGNGIFDPSATVTTAEAMLMLLKTLGYFQNASEFGDNWKLATTRKGTELNLYNQDEDGVLSADEPLVRENVASLAFRALTDVVQVQYNPTFQEYYNYGSSMTHGVDNNVVGDTLGYKNFDRLFAQDTTDAFGRPSVTWMYNGQEIGTYAVNADYTFTTEKTVKEIYNAVGSNILESELYNRAIIIDGETLDGGYLSEDKDDNNDLITITSDSTTIGGIKEIITSNDTTRFLESGNGVLTEIFMIAPEYDSDRNVVKKGELVITQIHTYLVEVTYCAETGDDEFEVGIEYHDKDYLAVTQGALVDADPTEGTFNTVFDSNKSYEKGDMLAINVARDSKGNWVVVESTVKDVTTVSGTATGSRLEPDVVGGSWLAVDGEQFDYAYSVRGNLDEKKVMVPVSQTEINVYLDQYGYVLGYEAEVEGAKYLYVEAKDQSAVMGGSRARVTFADGTEDIIIISYIDSTPISSSNWAVIPDSGRYEDTANNKTYSANENFVDGTEELQNRIFGYTLLSDGTYKLTTSIRGQYKANVDDSKGVLPGIDFNEDGSLTYSDDGSYGDGEGLHNIIYNESGAGTLIHSPEKDTMFIYTSTSYEGVAAAGEEDSSAFVSSSDYTFNIKAGNTRVTATGVGDANGEGTSHAFVVDHGTTFVDVVGDKTYTLSNVPEMNSGDLNMQVVFGEDGIADVVFINHGAPSNSGGDWFIVTDNEAVWALVDGVDTYTYKVWINGVEETIVSKDEELFSTNSDKVEVGLNNNDLYRIVHGDDDYVYTVERFYQLDGYANASASASLSQTSPYPMGAVEIVGNGVIIYANSTDEFFEDYDYNAGGNAWFDAVEEGSYTAMDAVTDPQNKGVFKADGFTYNDSTKFIVMTANGTTVPNSSDKYTIRVGSADDIRTINDSGEASWVDVVEADIDSGSSHPVAKTVLIIQPRNTGDTTSYPITSAKFNIQVHDTWNEPTYGRNWAVNDTSWDSSTRFRTDGTSMETAYVLEGSRMGDCPVNLIEYSESEVAAEIFRQFAVNNVELKASTVEILDLVGGGSNATLKGYGSWTARIVGEDIATGNEVTRYVTLTFHETEDLWTNKYSDDTGNGYGTFYAGFSYSEEEEENDPVDPDVNPDPGPQFVAPTTSQLSDVLTNDLTLAGYEGLTAALNDTTFNITGNVNASGDPSSTATGVRDVILADYITKLKFNLDPDWTVTDNGAGDITLTDVNGVAANYAIDVSGVTVIEYEAPPVNNDFTAPNFTAVESTFTNENDTTIFVDDVFAVAGVVFDLTAALEGTLFTVSGNVDATADAAATEASVKANVLANYIAGFVAVMNGQNGYTAVDNENGTVSVTDGNDQTQDYAFALGVVNVIVYGDSGDGSTEDETNTPEVGENVEGESQDLNTKYEYEYITVENVEVNEGDGTTAIALGGEMSEDEFDALVTANPSDDADGISLIIATDVIEAFIAKNYGEVNDVDNNGWTVTGVGEVSAAAPIAILPSDLSGTFYAVVELSKTINDVLVEWTVVISMTIGKDKDFEIVPETTDLEELESFWWYTTLDNNKTITGSVRVNDTDKEGLPANSELSSEDVAKYAVYQALLQNNKIASTVSYDDLTFEVVGKDGNEIGGAGEYWYIKVSDGTTDVGTYRLVFDEDHFYVGHAGDQAIGMTVDAIDKYITFATDMKQTASSVKLSDGVDEALFYDLLSETTVKDFMSIDIENNQFAGTAFGARGTSDVKRDDLILVYKKPASASATVKTYTGGTTVKEGYNIFTFGDFGNLELVDLEDCVVTIGVKEVQLVVSDIEDYLTLADDEFDITEDADVSYGSASAVMVYNGYSDAEVIYYVEADATNLDVTLTFEELYNDGNTTTSIAFTASSSAKAGTSGTAGLLTNKNDVDASIASKGTWGGAKTFTFDVTEAEDGITLEGDFGNLAERTYTYKVNGDDTELRASGSATIYDVLYDTVWKDDEDDLGLNDKGAYPDDAYLLILNENGSYKEEILIGGSSIGILKSKLDDYKMSDYEGCEFMVGVRKFDLPTITNLTTNIGSDYTWGIYDSNGFDTADFVYKGASDSVLYVSTEALGVLAVQANRVAVPAGKVEDVVVSGTYGTGADAAKVNVVYLTADDSFADDWSSVDKAGGGVETEWTYRLGSDTKTFLAIFGDLDDMNGKTYRDILAPKSLEIVDDPESENEN